MQEIDSLPFWDKELWENDLPIATSYLTMASRGCPYRCSFCFNNFFAKLPGRNRGKYVRQRSVENCIQELAEAKEAYLNTLKVRRSSDSQLASILQECLHAKRTMTYYGQLEKAVASLTTKDIAEAVKKHLDPERLIIVQAGDFAKK